MKFSVYILKSLVADRYYIGSTENVLKRIEVHNSSRAKWTKRYQPWVLEYFEEYETRGEAVKREKFLKSLKGIRTKLELVKTDKI
ncbi:MAG: GIY-YIG nuclease family protein [Melioribacteraceae bacterium]|nr:GIY-YIG nuclease family protein [Melioribacteraceae bacterium]